MKKIVFFDIDKTLYDYWRFLTRFYDDTALRFNLSQKEKDNLKVIYQENKLKYGYFSPDKFIDPIVKRSPHIGKSILTSIFWNKEMLQNNLYPDTKALFDIANIATIGIFSMGDEKFQKEKITAFKKIIDNKNIYVVLNKKEKIADILNKYRKYKIYIVDDHLEILLQAKEKDSSVFTILIDREKNNIRNDTIDATIDNLYQIIPLIND